MKSKFRKRFLPFLFLSGSLLALGFFSGESSFASAVENREPEANYLFRDTFYLSPQLKLKYNVYETEGFLLVRENKRRPTGEFAVVTGFESPVVESRLLAGVRSPDAAAGFIEKNARTIHFERVPIRELPLTKKDGSLESRFWVGQRAYPSLDEAKAKVVEAKTQIETGGGNFDRALALVTEFFPEEKPAPTPEETRARWQAEEELALKVLDWLDIGEKQYGILTGTPVGEPILWQAFGETTYRFTNLEKPRFNSEVGFWTNRLVFKGIRFIGEPTIDPYVEVTGALESNGKNFPKHLDLIAGVEYRPFNRSAFLYNFAVEGFHPLRFARNYRLFTQYMERKNVTDEITGSADTDWWFGTDIFYEWGLDLPLAWSKPQRENIADYIQDFFWGEYYGSYRFQQTDFGVIDSYDSWLLNSSAIFGLKVPVLKLPRNPINDKLEVMPYLRLEHTTNSMQADSPHQNRFLLIFGVRWMPFRSYQFEHNEWLFLTKFFAEYVGVGGTRYTAKAAPDNQPERDWFIGLKTSFRRY